MNKKHEEQIQDEIRKRVFAEEERKQEQLGADASRETLAEMTTLSQKEVDAIAQRVRLEMAQKETASKKMLKKTLIAAGIAAVVFGGILMMQYNALVGLEEQVNTKWSQVENVYQRRLDLVPNLVKTVQAYAEHEQEIFRMVTEARAKAGTTLSPDALQNSAALQEFQQAQSQLSNALRRMMALVENTPDIKGDQNFLALQAQLEGSENRIAVERKRFNEAVQAYNSSIKKFPRALIAGMFGFDEKSYFKADPGAENAPNVNFE